MDRLETKEQEKIRKMSDVRLTSHLVKAGVSAEEMETMDRPSMMERWAKIVASGGDKVPPATAGTAPSGYDVSLEREKLAFEKLKWEEERKERARQQE